MDNRYCITQLQDVPRIIDCCGICGSHDDVSQNYGLLGYDAVYFSGKNDPKKFDASIFIS